MSDTSVLTRHLVILPPGRPRVLGLGVPMVKEGKEEGTEESGISRQDGQFRGPLGVEVGSLTPSPLTHTYAPQRSNPAIRIVEGV